MEYALLIAVIIGVFSAMQLYVRRGMQARIKDGTDKIPGIVIGQESEAEGKGLNKLFSGVSQYEPYYIKEGSSDMTSTSSSGTEAGKDSQAGGTRTLTGATSSRTGTQVIIGAQNEDELKE